MSKEAMKLALEALEVATTPLARDRQVVLRAQAALREVLAEQPAQQQQCMEHGECFGGECIYPAPQPAQQQEPSEYVQKVIDALYENSDPVSVEAAELLEQMTQQQEPVAYVYEREIDGFGLRKDVKFLKPVEVGSDLYTSPPASKPWVGLTDQEIEDLWNHHEPRFDFYSFSCDIEAKLKEKNA